MIPKIFPANTIICPECGEVDNITMESIDTAVNKTSEALLCCEACAYQWEENILIKKG